MPEIRVWVRTDDLHFKSLTILLLVLPLPKQTNGDYDMTGPDEDNDEYKLNLLLNQRLLNAVKMLVKSRKEPYVAPYRFFQQTYKGRVLSVPLCILDPPFYVVLYLGLIC